MGSQRLSQTRSLGIPVSVLSRSWLRGFQDSHVLLSSSPRTAETSRLCCLLSSKIEVFYKKQSFCYDTTKFKKSLRCVLIPFLMRVQAKLRILSYNFNLERYTVAISYCSFLQKPLCLPYLWQVLSASNHGNLARDEHLIFLRERHTNIVNILLVSNLSNLLFMARDQCQKSRASA